MTVSRIAMAMAFGAALGLGAIGLVTTAPTPAMAQGAQQVAAEQQISSVIAAYQAGSITQAQLSQQIAAIIVNNAGIAGALASYAIAAVASTPAPAPGLAAGVGVGLASASNTLALGGNPAAATAIATAVANSGNTEIQTAYNSGIAGTGRSGAPAGSGSISGSTDGGNSSI